MLPLPEVCGWGTGPDLCPTPPPRAGEAVHRADHTGTACWDFVAVVLFSPHFPGLWSRGGVGDEAGDGLDLSPDVTLSSW